MLKKFAMLSLVLLAAVGCGDASTDSSVATTSSTGPKTEYYLNETATVNSVQIKANEVVTSPGDDSLYSFAPVEEGKEYVGIKFTVTNIDNEGFTLSSLLCFEAKHNNVTVDYELFAITLFGEDSLDAIGLPVGDSVVGWYAIQLADNWEQFTVTFRPELMSSNTAKFVFNNSDVA